MSDKSETPRTPPELWVVIENFDEGDGFSAFASQQLAMDHHQDLIDEVPECGPFLVCRYISAAALLADEPDVEGLVACLQEWHSNRKWSELKSAADALLAQQARIRELEGELAQARAELAAEEIRHGQSINCQKIERARADKAEADNKALLEDAERYRWLREHCNSMSVAPPLTVARVCGYGLEGWSGDNLDAAIDAARKGEA